MKIVAVVLYIFGTLLAGFLCFVYFSANAHLPFTISVTHMAWSSIPMLTLMALATYMQCQSARVLWVLPPVVIAAAATSFLAMVNHAFPNIAAVWSIIHLAVIVLGGVLAVLFTRRNNVSAL